MLDSTVVCRRALGCEWGRYLPTKSPTFRTIILAGNVCNQRKRVLLTTATSAPAVASATRSVPRLKRSYRRPTMDMRREKEPWAEAIREPRQQAGEGGERKFQPTLVEVEGKVPALSALADWQAGRDASTGGAGGPVPELIKLLAGKPDSGGWTSTEDELIRKCVQQYGFVWNLIAAALPGRSDGDVLCRWNQLETMRLKHEPEERRNGYTSSSAIKRSKAEEEEESLPQGPLQSQPQAGMPASTSGCWWLQPLAAPPMRLQEVRPPPAVGVWSCRKGCGKTFTHGRIAAWSIRRQHEETCMAPRLYIGSVDRDESTAAGAAASTAAERTDAATKPTDTAAAAAAAAAAAKENAEMQRAPAIACPSHATKRRAPRPMLPPKLPPSKQPRLGGLASSAAAARRPLQTLAVS